MYDGTRQLAGVEAVIDKDRSSACSPDDLEADLLVIATDADAVYLDWGTPHQRAIGRVAPDALGAARLPAGSMGPKVEAACDFARSAPGKVAVIGALARPAGDPRRHRRHPDQHGCGGNLLPLSHSARRCGASSSGACE